MSCAHKCFEQWDEGCPEVCTMCGLGVVACIDDLRARLATAERERDKAVAAKELAERELNLQCNSMAEQWNAEVEAVKRERDEAIAACQQKHGVHPSWVNAVEKMRKERDEAREKLAVAVEALDSAHNALDQAMYRSVVGADVGTEALNAVREALASIRGDKR